MPNGTEWPEERVNLLCRRWKEGATAAEIAAEIGGTRSAIIGRVRRMREGEVDATPAQKAALKPRTTVGRPRTKSRMLPSRPVMLTAVPSPVMPDTSTPPAPVTPPDVVIAPEPEAPAPQIDRDRIGTYGLIELGPGQCHWPTSDSMPYTFCGAPATGSYCQEHQRRLMRSSHVKDPYPAKTPHQHNQGKKAKPGGATPAKGGRALRGADRRTAGRTGSRGGPAKRLSPHDQARSTNR